MDEKVKELLDAAKIVANLVFHHGSFAQDFLRLSSAVEALEHEAVAEMLLKLKAVAEKDLMGFTYNTYYPESREAFLAAIDAWFDLNKGK